MKKCKLLKCTLNREMGGNGRLITGRDACCCNYLPGEDSLTIKSQLGLPD